MSIPLVQFERHGDALRVYVLRRIIILTSAEMVRTSPIGLRERIIFEAGSMYGRGDLEAEEALRVLDAMRDGPLPPELRDT